MHPLKIDISIRRLPIRIDSFDIDFLQGKKNQWINGSLHAIRNFQTLSNEPWVKNSDYHKAVGLAIISILNLSLFGTLTLIYR